MSSLGKQGIDDLLFLLHVFLSFLELSPLTLIIEQGRSTLSKIAEAMVTSAKTSFHWEKVLFEVKTVEAFS